MTKPLALTNLPASAAGVKCPATRTCCRRGPVRQIAFALDARQPSDNIIYVQPCHPGYGRAIDSNSMPTTRFLTLLALAFAVAPAGADSPTPGEQVYRKRCASCHGPDGEGTKTYPHQLTGDRTAAQLAKYIAKSMPEDDPGTCVGEEADAVAAYLYEKFYSPAAREKLKPPRVELSRLTVRQYRNAVADLVGSFRGPSQLDAKRGLRGEYFDARGFRNDKRVIDRTDPVVNFDFGTDGPADEEHFDPYQFSIRWSGTVLAAESGEYEFVVRSDHAVRLWVNDLNKPLIDAWVKSGSDIDFKGTIVLLGGRSYSLRLEFSKAKQGVDDSKTKKIKPRVSASVALLWRPPQRVLEVIPERHLTPGRAPEVYVPLTPFPPDDKSLGWERATAISKAWDAATTDAALETAGYIAARLPDFGARDEAKAKAFCARFVERAFRRPPSDELKSLYVERQFEGRDIESAVKRVVLLTLKSPRFLYREVDGAPAYDTASRLAFALWDAPPDQALLDAAAAGKLATREQVAKQAERLLADPRARAKVREFFLQWLKVDPVPDLTKAASYAGFDASIASDLRTSLELFLNDVVWGASSDFRQLLLADDLYLNGRLAKFYGADLPADAPFQKVALDGGQREGVLTHPYLMATFAYTATTSPIHRGVFLARSVLGVAMRPPPEAVAPLAPDLHPQLTTRERTILQTKSLACQSCHSTINPLGFALERFDTVGRFRATENGKPVDTTGSYLTRSGAVVTFAGVRDLAKFLADSPEAHDAFVEQVFHNLVKQPVRAYGREKPAELRKYFTENGYSIRKLMVEIATAAAIEEPRTKNQEPKKN
ncbi:MAG: DUF1592 domain-containing protein [Gemmataceae bacterium]